MSGLKLDTELERAYPIGSAAAGEVARRKMALAAFEQHGFPSRRLEAWRYTDLSRLEKADFAFGAPRRPPASSLAAARAALAALPVSENDAVAVFIDGHLAPTESRLPDGMLRQHTATSAAEDSAGDYPSPEPRHALAALTDAFAAPFELVLDRNALAGIDSLVMLFCVSAPGLATQLRFDISVAADVSARLVQHFASTAADASGWTNMLVDIELGAGSALELTRIQELTPAQSMTTLMRPRLGADSRLTLGSIDIGGALVRTDLEIRLEAAGASTELFGLSMAGAGRHIDNHVSTDHVAPDTRSRQTYRSIVDEGGRVVFNGKVVVRPDAQRIDAHQRSDNLLLAKNAEVDTKPELEIYADDVRCSHGATIGELDELELFYLRSRGIPADVARELLTFGFANRVLADIRDEALRRHVGGRISSVFGSSLTAAEALSTALETAS